MTEAAVPKYKIKAAVMLITINGKEAMNPIKGWILANTKIYQ